MDARRFKILLAVSALASVAASHRTPNFVVTAPTPEIAQQVATAAEQYRRELAVEWLGRELPPWYAPCTVQVKVGQLGAGGATSFNFDRGEVFGWTMNIQGPLDRILDSVLPHEVTHTIFACHFRRPVPRWADEGAATLAEIDSEKRRQQLTVKQIIGTRQRIPLRTLVSMKEYPSDMRDVMKLYAQGYSLAELLVQRGGKALYLKFLGDAHQQGWERAVETHYGYRGLDALEKDWHDWILAGSPAQKFGEGQKVASTTPARPVSQGAAVIRGQSPDFAEDPFLESSILTVAAPPAVKGDGRLHAPAPRRTAASAPTPAPAAAFPAARDNAGWVAVPSKRRRSP